jgi:transcriptional regulator of acetoin/glycerol metabolism
MIPWIDPSDPRMRLGATMYTSSPELLEIYAKIPALCDGRYRKRGPKKSTAIFRTADEFKEGLMQALMRMKGNTQEWSVTNLARTYGVARSTLYETANRLQVNVLAFIQDFLRS